MPATLNSGCRQKDDIDLTKGNVELRTERKCLEVKKILSYILTLVLMSGIFNVNANEIDLFDEAKLPEIESVTVKDTSIIAGYNCEDGIYELCIPPFSVKLKDGREFEVQNDGGYCMLDGYMYQLGVNARELQQEEPWQIGNTYNVTGFFGDLSTNFNVSIVENPVECFIVDDINIYENTNGKYIYDENGDKYFKYERHYGLDALFNPTKYRVILKDGNISENTNSRNYGGGGYTGIYIDNQFYKPDSVSDNQETNHWNVGTHKAVAELLGFKSEFNINIFENTIEDIKVHDYTVIRGIDGHDYENGNYYCLIDPIAEVKYTNGDIINKQLSELPINSCYAGLEKSESSSMFASLPSLTTFKIGTYDYSVTVNGKVYPFKVKLVENPVKSVEILNNPFKTKYLVGESVFLEGIKLRLNYNDGTYEDVNPILMPRGQGNDFVVSNKLKRTIEIDIHIQSSECSGFNESGVQQIELSVAGKKAFFDVSVYDNNIESISIKSKDNKRLIITFLNSDNTEFDMEVLKISSYGGSYDVKTNIGVMGAEIRTDNGSYSAEINSEENSIKISLLNFSSNILNDFKLNESDYYHYTFSNQGFIPLKHYNGKITTENIDAVIFYAINSLDYYDLSVIHQLKGSDVKLAVRNKFIVDDIDLTLSENYDSKTDKYRLDDHFKGYRMRGYLIETIYQNGIHNFKYKCISQSTVKVAHVMLDDKFRIISIDFEYETGDVNRDDIVDVRDLIFLKKQLAVKNNSEYLNFLDVSCDGKVDASDLVALKKIILSW